MNGRELSNEAGGEFRQLAAVFISLYAAILKN